MKRWLVLLSLLVAAAPAVAGQSFFSSLSDAWLTIKVSAACDYSNPVTREFAMDVAKPSRSGELSLTQVCNIFDAITKPHWTYFHDPYRTRFGEDVAYASESITTDYAVTATTMLFSWLRAFGRSAERAGSFS